MEEQYITDKCINKLNDIAETLCIINSSFKISWTMQRLGDNFFYVLFIRYSDSKAPVHITIEEYWLYTESLHSLVGKVIEEICKELKK